MEWIVEKIKGFAGFLITLLIITNLTSFFLGYAILGEEVNDRYIECMKSGSHK